MGIKVDEMKVTLRYAITEYTRWVAALWAAASRQTIDLLDMYEKLEDVKRELKRWVGKDLLDKEL